MKALTVRLDDGPALALELVARVDGVSVTDAIRAAVIAHVRARQADPTFSARRAQLMAALDKLEPSAPSPTLPASPSPPQEGPADAQP